MKKIILIIIVFCLLFAFQKSQSQAITIPDEAIRIRVIANSNSMEDQYIKSVVRKTVENDVYDLLKNVDHINEARNMINGNLDLFNKSVEKTLLDNNHDLNFNLNFGLNYFPKKVYKGVTYEEGMYESLVVSLGSAQGDNWWCVLFPPLCLMEAQSDENIEDVEYQFFVKTMIDKYFK